MPGKELFNRLYAEEQWAPILLRPHAFSTTRYDDVARLLLPERGRVLEFGCGSGGLLIALAERFDEAVGVDLSDRRIALARRILAERYPQYSGKLRFQCIGGGEPLPFEDASSTAWRPPRPVAPASPTCSSPTTCSTPMR